MTGLPDEMSCWSKRYASALPRNPPVQSMVDLQTAVREVDRLFKLQLEHRDQVVKKMQLDEELHALEHSQQQLDTELAAAKALADSAHASWQNIWQSRGVQCGDPRSMREWLTQHQTLLDVWQEVQQLQMQRQEAELAIHNARAELIAALQSVGDDWDASAADLAAIHARALQVDETLQAEAVAYQNRMNQVACWPHNWLCEKKNASPAMRNCKIGNAAGKSDRRQRAAFAGNTSIDRRSLASS